MSETCPKCGSDEVLDELAYECGTPFGVTADQPTLTRGCFITQIASLTAQLAAEKERCRTAAQTIIAAIGASGPENVEESAVRIVERLDAAEARAAGLAQENYWLTEGVTRIVNECRARIQKWNSVEGGILFDVIQMANALLAPAAEEGGGDGK